MSTNLEGIIVLGMPRSGTTLVRRLIGAHPNISCPAETNLLSSASRFLEEHTFAGGLSIGAVPGLGFSGISEEQSIDRIRQFIVGFFEEIASSNNKPRWAEKTAVDIFHLDSIERIFGERCQYVCIFRHPLDVICSIRELSDKMEMYLPELHDYISKHLSPLIGLAHAWTNANARLLQFIADHPGKTVVLKYEELTASPLSEVERLFKFLKEPIDGQTLIESTFSSNSSVGLGDWKTYEATTITKMSVGRHATLDPHIVNRLADIVNPTMQRIGYKPIQVVELPSDEDAQRKFQISRMVAGMQNKTD